MCLLFALFSGEFVRRGGKPDVEGLELDNRRVFVEVGRVTRVQLLTLSAPVDDV